ncbi:MAG: GH3 auxin-responsive promoter family protein [Bacteroidia bacterium]
MSWYLKKRVQSLHYVMKNGTEVQQDTLDDLLSQLKKTSFGKEHKAKSIKSYRDFKSAIPLQTYDQIKVYIERTIKGEQKVLWPGDIKWFAKSSGTTSDKSKFIPVSFDALNECQFKGSRDTLAFYYHQNADAKVFQGKGLIIGGSHQVNELSPNSFYGDLSAVMMNNLPFIANYLATPSIEIALLDNWEEKMDRIVAETMHEDVTNISGVPSWTLLVIKRLLEKTGAKTLKEVWPNLELYIHGGVNFNPYREQFKALIGSDKMNYRETFNASEGFFGVQDKEGEDMLLMLDYGIFYEFIPMEHFGEKDPPTIWLDEIELNTNYAMVITTNAGLWRYILGDTIQFTSKSPYRIKITGRTKLFINAFGEELMIDNAETALAAAQLKCDCLVAEFTAAPVYLSTKDKGSHEWLIEFDRPPKDLEEFATILDDELKKTNSDYEAKRAGNLALLKPQLNILPNGTFYKWMKSKNKLGGQHKVPRLSNNRKILEDILKFDA